MKSLKILLPVIILILINACNTTNDKIVNEYYPDGTIKTKIEVKNSMRNGLTKNFDEKGRLLSTAELVNDKYEGWLITYNPANGKVTARSHYKDDKQNGAVTTYYDQGQLYREMTYVNGRVDSLVKTYWPDGSIQAEVYFKMGAPAIGLKEYDREGNSVNQPHIVIEEINQLAAQNSVTLKVYLSDKNTKADFYKGDLMDEKYLAEGTLKVNDENGVAMLQYNVQRKHRLSQEISIIARTRTKFGNTLVLHRYYNLVVSN